MQEEFYLKIYLFKPNHTPPIKIARDSQLRITVELMDYTIPEGSTAAAYSKGSYSGKIFTQDCQVTGNKITFIPKPGFFVYGKNNLQYKINNGAITLSIDVNCEISLPDGGEAATPEQVLPLVQRAENAAKSAEDSKKAAEESKKAAAGSAEAADQSAKDASGSAEEAGNAANAAGQAKEAAEQSAEEAGNAANAAGQAKEAAEQSVEEAGNAANAVEQAKVAAEQRAEEAGNAANAAGEAAHAAGEAAQSAGGSAKEAEDSALSIRESAEQIRQNTESIIRVENDKADKKALFRTDRSLDALWKLNQGVSYQFETDDAVAYSKTVPSGAKLASVEQIGGNTVIWNHLLRNGNFNGVSYWIAINSTLSANNNELVCDTFGYFGGFTADPINASVFAGHKYLAAIDVLATSGLSVYWPYFDGDIIVNYAKNTCTGEYQHCVGIYTAKATGASLFGIRMTENIGIKAIIMAKNAIFIDLTQMFGPGREPTSTDDPRIAWIDQYAAEHPEYNAGELVSADVESVNHNNVVMADIPAAVRNLPGYGWSAGDVCNSIERTETGWQYVQRVGSREYLEGDTVTDGVTSYYALDSHIITDISELMNGALDAIPVEPGGTLTFENAAKLPVPSSVEYAIKLSEVSQG